MLGVPVEDHERFKGWSLDIARGLDSVWLPPESEIRKRSGAARHAIGDYMRGLIAERRASPRGDLLSALIAAEEAGDKLSEDELIATCILAAHRRPRDDGQSDRQRHAWRSCVIPRSCVGFARLPG